MEYVIGGNVKSYLKSKGISQAFVSEKTGIPVATLSERLNDKSELRAKELFKICDALGVPLETFRRAKTDDQST